MNRHSATFYYSEKPHAKEMWILAMEVGQNIIKSCKKNRVRILAEIDTLTTPFITRMYIVSRLVVTSRATV